jgi:hypothetical protein
MSSIKAATEKATAAMKAFARAYEAAQQARNPKRSKS